MGRINKTRINIKRLDELIKDLDQNISIWVGIRGAKARQMHADSNLTNADLGAVHEFGATINVTDKMRKYLASQGIYLKKETQTITIPARSFLREPILSDEGRKAIRSEFIKKAKNDLGRQRDLNFLGNQREGMLENIGYYLAEAAYNRVMEAFNTGGFGQWEPISEFTREHRKGDASNPPLTDQGDLKEAIDFGVEKQ